jgi:Zn-dependent protease
LPGFDLQRGLLTLIPLVLSLTVHEWAHAWSAWKLGDDTAARLGRLSLNPLVHLDPIGTIIGPLFGVPFGWARPVPIQPSRFRRGVSQSGGMALTAAAGPISNLVLAVATTIFSAIFFWYVPGQSPALVALLDRMAAVNVTLFLFNLLPVPPLDGSRIVDHFIPYRHRPTWERVVAFSPILFVAVILFGGRIIAGPANFLGGLLDRLWYVLRPV